MQQFLWGISGGDRVVWRHILTECVYKGLFLVIYAASLTVSKQDCFQSLNMGGPEQQDSNCRLIWRNAGEIRYILNGYVYMQAN